MRPPTRLVLRGEHAPKRVGEVGPDYLKFWCGDPYRHATAEVHQAGCLRPRTRSAREFTQPVAEFRAEAGWQVMEKSEMRRHTIASGREMRAPQSIEPGKVLRPE